MKRRRCGLPLLRRIDTQGFVGTEKSGYIRMNLSLLFFKILCLMYVSKMALP
jgi:hypothetical protein